MPHLSTFEQIKWRKIIQTLSFAWHTYVQRTRPKFEFPLVLSNIKMTKNLFKLTLFAQLINISLPITDLSLATIQYVFDIVSIYPVAVSIADLRHRKQIKSKLRIFIFLIVKT